MFDFAWSEIALIAAVALIAIGPKDMPVALRAVSGMIKKARRMAAEFQTHVDEMLREANLDEVRSSFNDIRNFDIRSKIEKAVDPDGSLRSTFTSNPLEPTPSVTPDVADLPPAEDVAAEAVIAEPVVPEPPGIPAFIPPELVAAPEPAQIATEDEAPAFIPPAAVLQRRSRPAP